MSDSTIALRHWRKRLTVVTHLLEQPLLANAGYLLGSELVGGMAGFAFWGLAARWYQPEDVGMASATLSAALLLSGLADLGIGVGLVRFLPEASAPRRLLNTVFTFNTVIAFLFAVVYVLGLRLWSPSLLVLGQSPAYFVGFVIFVVVTAQLAITRMAFVASRQAGYAFMQTCSVSLVRLLLLVGMVGLGTMGMVVSVAVSTTLAAALGFLGFLPKVQAGYRVRPGLATADLGRILPYSLGNFAAGLLLQNSQVILPLLALELRGAAASGYMYVAWMLGGLLISPALALAQSAFAEGSHEPAQLPGILRRATGIGLAVTMPAAILLGICAPKLLLLLFGDAYAEGATELLRWLALAAPLVVLARLYLTYLRVQKRIGLLVALSGLVVIVTLGVSALWMPSYGITVSGIGWLVGSGLVVLWAVYRFTGKNRLA